MQTTDVTGTYRFDRLPPGSYNVKFELQGFKTIDRAGIAINASFVATVNAKLEVGSVSETITVTGESPTVDTKSNLQQTVMNQEILEGVPSGRDPWSVAKIIPGVQVATYDVGGTQSYPAELAVVAWVEHQRRQLQHRRRDRELAGWRRWRDDAVLRPGDVRGSELHDVGDSGRGHGGRHLHQHGHQGRRQQVARRRALQLFLGLSDAPGTDAGLSRKRQPAGSPDKPAGFLGNPTQTTYDFNVAGGGALLKDRLWVNGSYRRWVVNKLVNAKNEDKTQAIDDNTLKNYSGKGVFSATSNQKVTFVVQLEQQDSWPPPRRFVQRARHCVTGAAESGVLHAGEVHRHPQQAGVRVLVQCDGRHDELSLSAQHARIEPCARRTPS